MFLTSALAALTSSILSIISTFGYPGIFFLMTLESMVFPVPSELIMPFAGFLSETGRFNPVFAFMAAILGSLAGSILSYYIGKKTGYSLISKYGKYFLVNRHELERTELWFRNQGEKTIFISRLVPVVRHLISLPAGIGKMDIRRFILFTFAGASVWNLILLAAGFALGRNWDIARRYSDYLSIVVVAAGAVAAIWLILRLAKEREKTANA